MREIGLRLREERERLKLTQKAFGLIGGVEPNAQGKYENGNRSPKADYLAAVAQAGVDILYVVTGRRETIAADGLNELEEIVLGNYRTLPTQGQEALSQMAVTLAEMAATYSHRPGAKARSSST